MIRKALLLASALLAAGCAHPTPPPGLPSGDVPAAFEQTALAGGTWPAPDWWRGFGSRELTALETAAQANNFDIVQAAARLRQADARARQAGAALMPTVSLNGNGQKWNRAYALLPRHAWRGKAASALRNGVARCNA